MGPADADSLETQRLLDLARNGDRAAFDCRFARYRCTISKAKPGASSSSR